MAFHATPSLSWGDPAPSYPHESCDVARALVVIGERGSAHVATEAEATEVLRRLGLTEDKVQDRLHFAKTGQIL